jgi:hypothetical protein
MTRAAIGSLGLLVLLPALQAQNKPETPTPAQQYQALEKEYQTAVTEYREAIAKIKTREEGQKLQEKRPWADKFAPRFLELAERYPKNPAAVDALVWIARHETKQRDPQSLRSKALRILLRDHVQSEKMATLCPALGGVGLGYAQDKDCLQLLHAVLEKSQHHPSRGQACFALARHAEGCLRAAQELKDDPESARKLYEFRLSKEVVDALAKADPDKLSKEAETYYERVIKDFADVAYPYGGTLGELAKENLDELRHSILVGKPAPDIEGEDIDGVKFKLSDYRGKVVLLDFWGHW